MIQTLPCNHAYALIYETLGHPLTKGVGSFSETSLTIPWILLIEKRAQYVTLRYLEYFTPYLSD